MKRFIFIVVVVMAIASTAQAQRNCPSGNCPTPQGQLQAVPPGYQQAQPQAQRPDSYSQYQGNRNAALYAVVCRVSVPRYDQPTHFNTGSAVLVRSRRAGCSYVLTAAHILRGGDIEKVVVTFPATGKKYLARVVENDAKSDGAVLLIATPAGIAPAAVAKKRPRNKMRITMAGYGGKPRRGFIAHAGYLTGTSEDSYTVSSPSSQGDSGGPVVDANGDVIGIVSMTSASTTYVSYGPVRWLLGLPPRYGHNQRSPPQNYGQPQAPPPVLIRPDVTPVDSITRAEVRAMIDAEVDTRRAELTAYLTELDETKAEVVSARAEAVNGDTTLAEKIGNLHDRVDGVIAVVDAVPDPIKAYVTGKISERVSPETLAKIDKGLTIVAAVHETVGSIKDGQQAPPDVKVTNEVKAAPAPAVPVPAPWYTALLPIAIAGLAGGGLTGAGVALGKHGLKVATGQQESIIAGLAKLLKERTGDAVA